MSTNTSATAVPTPEASEAPIGCEVSFLCSLEGLCTYVSPEIQIQRGYRPDELVGRSLYLHLPDESVLLLREMLAEAVDLLRLESQEAPVQFEDKVEHQVGCSDGSLQWVETRVTLQRNPAGSATGFLCVSRTITPAE